jgi:hypothetical protein
MERAEGKGLLHTYLMALARHDEIIRLRRTQTTELDAVVADWLTAARNDYWYHVQKHKCRLERKDYGL